MMSFKEIAIFRSGDQNGGTEALGQDHAFGSIKVRSFEILDINVMKIRKKNFIYSLLKTI